MVAGGHRSGQIYLQLPERRCSAPNGHGGQGPVRIPPVTFTLPLKRPHLSARLLRWHLPASFPEISRRLRFGQLGLLPSSAAAPGAGLQLVRSLWASSRPRL